MCTLLSKIQRLIVLGLINNSLASEVTESNSISLFKIKSNKITDLPVQFADIFFFITIINKLSLGLFL